MPQQSGRITVVQEGRFLLEDDGGHHRLFITSHHLNFNPEDLRGLARDRQRITVRYSEPEHLIAAQAERISLAENAVNGSARAPHHGLGGTIRGFIDNWSLPRQLLGQSPNGEAARSAESQRLKPRLADADKVGTSICAYCAVGCAQLVYAKDNKVIHVEGDPRSPINQGTLCPKGAATLDLLNSPLRLNRVMYRAPGSDHWEQKPLDWAMERIAQLVKKTRDETFVEKLPNGTTVNHTIAMGSLGGATLDNEENYLIKKLLAGGLGMVWIENQARVCHSASVPSLGATYGRGAATLPQWDLANSDCVVVMGSNMAENHPIAFRFVVKAKEKGATVIHVDPRFTRTSALADIYAPIRTGTDIAFLGGIIHYLLENDLFFKEWALEFTNLATIIDERFQDADALDGLFSGWNAQKGSYQYESWQYQGQEVPSSLAEHSVNTTESFSEKTKRMENGPPPQDPTLQHPNCVYQIMRRHYARYTPEMVERITGCPKETFVKVAEALARNSGRERTSAFCYAVAWTHHTTGVQIIRAAGIIQALLGNAGRPGGGILALRGHCSIQGSTDIPSLYNMLPTYLPQPQAYKQHGTFDDFIKHETTSTGWWHNFPKYAVSLLKAWYGEHSTRENGWGYEWLPKIVGDHSQLPMTLAMNDGIIRGMMFLGQNPVIGGSNSRLIERGLANLEWMVVRDITETETAGFWRSGQLVRKGELTPEKIKTEVFLMPATLAGEKGGTFTNTHRLIQWHDKVVDGPGDNRSELWFMYHLGRRLKELYADSKDPKDDADSESHLGLCAGGRARRAGRRVRIEGDERPHGGGRQAHRLVPEAEGRRLHCLRRLALLRHLSRREHQQGALAPAGRARRSRQPSQLGLRLARQPPQHVQPRLGRRAGTALVRAQEADVVGRRQGQMGRHRLARLRADQAAGLPARLVEEPGGHGCARRPLRLHHDCRRQGLAVRADGAEGRTAADALRTGRVALEECALLRSRIIRSPRNGSARTIPTIRSATRVTHTRSPPTG